MNHLIDNWLVLLSLVIALVGGIPGILAAISHFKNKPIFHFSLDNITTGEFSSDGISKSRSMIFLVCTISNSGPQPLSPNYFELSINVDGQWYLFERTLVPENMQLRSDVQNVKIFEPWKHDLQKFSGPIKLGQPIHGFLMFLSSEFTWQELRELIEKNCLIKVTCVDIYQKKYYKKIKPEFNVVLSPTVYPKHGVSIMKKT